MFTSISINNFRCFEDFSIESLDRINLIAGTNNVGKTTMLEAISLLIGVENIGPVVNINTFRSAGEFRGNLASVHELLWSPLFFEFDSQTTIKISGTLNTGRQYIVALRLVPRASARLAFDYNSAPETGLMTSGLLDKVMRLRYMDSSSAEETEMLISAEEIEILIDEKGMRVEPVPSQPSFPGLFLPARSRITPQQDAARFGQLEMVEESYNILETLKIVEPRLKRLTTIFSAGVPMIYGDIGLGQMLPLPLMGDGLGRLMSLLLAIANAPGGIVLVDEIENGLHHSILNKVWRAIGDAARHFKTQIFATTHSYECIRAAHQAFEGSDGYDFRLHRLDRINEKIRVVTYDEEVLAAAIKADMEVR